MSLGCERLRLNTKESPERKLRVEALDWQQITKETSLQKTSLGLNLCVNLLFEVINMIKISCENNFCIHRKSNQCILKK